MSSDQLKLPAELGIRRPTIVPPTEGWEALSYYVVDVAFSSNNPVHRAIFHSGFLDDVAGVPQGYNGFMSADTTSSRMSDAYYMRVVSKIDFAADTTQSENTKQLLDEGDAGLISGDTPDRPGMYVAYVENEWGLSKASKKLLTWVDNRWSHPGSDQIYRGPIFAFIGPLPSYEIPIRAIDD